MNNPFETINARLSNIENLLLELKHSEKTIQNISSDNELLTIQDAANFLNLSVPTIYSLVSQSKIPVNKRGKRLYFSKIELITWIKSGRRKTIDEISKEAESYIKSKLK